MSSLRSVLKKLERKKYISKEDLNEAFKRLDNHDKVIKNQTIDYVIEYIESKSEDWKFNLGNSFEFIDFIFALDEIAEELKQEQEVQNE